MPKASQVFVFLDPVNEPSAGRTAKSWKEIRSHVTTQQHRNRKHQGNKRPKTLKAKRQAGLEGLKLAGRSTEGEEEEAFDELLPVVSPSADLSNPLTAAFRGGTLAFQLYILNDPANIVGKILNGLGTDALSILKYYENLVRLQTPEWERQYAPLTKPGIAYKHLIPALFQDPALIGSCMLLSLSHLIASRKQPMEPQIIFGILQLRGYVMRCINEALNDQSRAACDHVIVATLLLATCEALHGLRESYPIHMIGLMDMVNYRGGLSALGFEGCVEAFILWQDANIANIVGGQTYSHLAKNRSPLPDAKVDKDHFLAGAVLTADSFAEENEGKDASAWRKALKT